jgi:hypothetical protein
MARTNDVCRHPDRKHYGKGMCNPCWQHFRQNGTLERRQEHRPRWSVNDVCGHLDRTHHAKGMCNACYRSLQRLKDRLPL